MIDSLHEWSAFPIFACKNNATLCQNVGQAREKSRKISFFRLFLSKETF